MKRNLILAAAVITSFVGVSCEKHRWEDKVETVEEEIYDKNDNLVETIKTKVVAEKGAKRFFIEEPHGHDEHAVHSEHKDHADHGQGNHDAHKHDEKPHAEGKHDDHGHSH